MINIFKFAIKHKIITAVAAIAAVGAVIYGFSFLGGGQSQTAYVLSAAEKGSIISSVEGSGQVSASKQVDVKATVSGDVVYVNAIVGQEVQEGHLIAQLDTTDALKSIRDAETNLESAKLSLERLMEPTAELTILQAENSLNQAKQTKTDAEASLAKSYKDGFAAIETIFASLPNLMVRLKSTVIGDSYQNNINYYVDAGKYYDPNMADYGNNALSAYNEAAEQYQKNFNTYLLVNRSSDNEDIYALIEQTIDTLDKASEAIKADASLISHLYDVVPSTQGQTVSDTKLTTLNTDGTSVKTYLASAIAAKNSIDTYKKTLSSAEWSVTEKTASLEELKEGPDELDLRAQQMSISQKEDSLADAKAKLGDYYIRAPFDGVIAAMNVSQGDSIASISSYGTIATIITKNRVAEISLNESDAASVKTGQKATLSFDAVDGLTITGTVSEIDTIGTVSQNVVTYSAKIVFDTEDDRIKPGMSVTASIITESKQDLLLVPSAAVKSSGDTYYVETVEVSSIPSGQDATSSTGVVLSSKPVQKTIEIGSSDDTMIEVISGLDEGDLVVVKTVVQTQSSSQAKGLFSIGGNRSGNSNTKSSSSSTKSSGSSQSGGMPEGGMPGGMGPGM